MIEKLKRHIYITGCDETNQSNQNVVFTNTFKCENCKHVAKCFDVQKCKFVAYVQDRVKNCTVNYDEKNPHMVITVPDSDCANRVFNIVNRAKKLRTFKSLYERCK